MAVGSSVVSVGAAARGIELLDVTGQEWQNRVVNDPVTRRQVAAIIKGESLRPISLDDLLAREIELTTRFFTGIGTIPHDEQIKRALEQAQDQWGGLTENDRFVPLIGLEEAFQFHYGWNAKRKTEGLLGLKLGHEQDKEWWRTDKQVEHLPTVAGVIRCNFATLMEWTDLDGRPFNLNYDEHMTWGSEQGGDGITSVEDNVYLNARSLMERGLPLIPLGLLRCRNCCGSGDSLNVRCDAAHGFDVEHWPRFDQHWSLGAVSRKFVALGN